MSPDPRPTPVRSAAVINAAIRGLWARAGGVLLPSQREEYERLVVEYAAAVRVEAELAA